MTFLDALTGLYRAAAGSGPPDGFVDAVIGILALNHIPLDAETPPYFLEGLMLLSRGKTSDGWSDVASADRGLSYILGEIAPLIPSATYRNVDHRDELAVHKLGLALIVETSPTEEHWTVGPVAALVPVDKPTRVLDTFSPDAAQVRRWAYDASIRLTNQDESDALNHDPFENCSFCEETRARPGRRATQGWRPCERAGRRMAMRI